MKELTLKNLTQAGAIKPPYVPPIELPRYKELANAVELEIAEGRIKSGDSIGSLTTLSKQLQMPREYVKVALQILKNRSVVVSRGVDGYFVL